jgi:hypothetical protein
MRPERAFAFVWVAVAGGIAVVFGSLLVDALGPPPVGVSGRIVAPVACTELPPGLSEITVTDAESGDVLGVDRLGRWRPLPGAPGAAGMCSTVFDVWDVGDVATYGLVVGPYTATVDAAVARGGGVSILGVGG